MRWFKISSLTLLMVLIAGCAGYARQDPSKRNWQEHSSQLSSLVHWKMDGKMALRDADRSESATVSWLQHNQHTEIRLSGPLGLRATTISGDGENVEVTQAEGTSHYSMRDTRAIYAATGLELPLRALPYWLKGLPDPDAAIDRQELLKGQLKLLVQSGWAISYDQYEPFNTYWLPTKLKMSRADTQVRLIMRQWKTEGIE